MASSSPPPLPAMAQPAGTAQAIQQSKPTLLEAVAAASPLFAEIYKDSENTYLKSRYLKLPGLLKIVKPALLEQGVIIYTEVVFESVAALWVVRTTLHSLATKEELSSDFPIAAEILGNLQKIGGVITYGTRYNLFALLAICPDDDDDDGNSAAFGGPAATPAGLPGLPGVGAPSAFQHLWPGEEREASSPAASLPGMIANPVQPLPVLPQ